MVLAVSEFTRKELLEFAHRPDAVVVYNGVDHNKFTPQGQKENLVMTVGLVGKERLWLKGFDTFIEVARLLPGVKFLIVGAGEESLAPLKKIAPDNVRFVGPVSQEELIEFYRRAKVYCQLSYRESFGMAVAESMLCGCNPVVTKAGALPEIVGEVGSYVSYGDPQATAIAVERALRMDRGREARERITQFFSLQKREEKLVDCIKKLIASRRT